MLALVALVLMASGGAAAERAKSPADATVFIRLVGSVHVEVEDLGLKETFDREHVEIDTGTGFVISPYGYVLTNHHVVSTVEFVVTKGSRKAKITVTQSRVEVCFPPEASAAGRVAAACSEASTYASDPALDLAVLYVSVPNLPYLALGDSDIVVAGQPVDALGYPFGRRLEVGLAIDTPDVVPEISTTPGSISATRSGEGGGRRYLQISNNVNPGNSGGPVVDRDGFAVGVIRMKLENAAGIAFAIPINQVKDFLELHGVDQEVPARRIRLGPLQIVEGKGVGLRLPEGLTDISPLRSRVETDAKSPIVALRIDRVLSSWNPKQIEQVLVGTRSFEGLVTATSESRAASRADDTRVLTGRATGAAPDGNREIGMEYAILDLGPEKLVARYIGPMEQIAFNASVLRESLIGLEGRLLVVGDLDPVEKLRWSATPMTDGQTRVAVPAGWVIEARAPTSCTGLPQASAIVAASPAQDFTVGVRAAVWFSADFAPEQAASACSSRRGSFAAASYASRVEWLGVSYSIEGTFARMGGRQVIQLEVVAPDHRNAFARALLASWIKMIPAAALP